MTDPIVFIVDGEPKPKQSTRFDGKGHAHTDPKVKAWQDKVSWRAREIMQGDDPISGKVAVRLVFVLGNRRVIDCDNLSKAILDALKGIVFGDDSNVVNLHIVKHTDLPNPGVFISVYAGEKLPMFEEGIHEIQIRTSISPPASHHSAAKVSRKDEQP